MQTVNWYKNSKELKIRMCLSIQKNYWQVSLAESSTNNREMSNILFILLPLVVAQEVSELLILNSWFNLLHTTITTTIKQVILSYRPWSQPPSQKTPRWTLPPQASYSILTTWNGDEVPENPRDEIKHLESILWLITPVGRCATTRQAWHWEAQTTGTSPSTSRQGGP